MQDTNGRTTASEQQVERAERFRALHHGGPVLQLANAWDGWSARIMAAAGAPAIGTTSFGVSARHGVFDGEQLAFDTVLAVAAEVTASVDVPVTVDLEAGRGAGPDDVAASTGAVLRLGAVGVNIEDAVPGQAGVLFGVDDQSARLAAARRAADAFGVPAYLNARCDVFFGAAVSPDRQVDEVLSRAEKYAAAGADGLFLPGLLDLEVIRRIASAVDLPLNVMAGPGIPALDDLAAAGVRRVSQGGDAFIALGGALKGITTRYLGGELTAAPELMGEGFVLLPELLRPVAVPSAR